LLRRWVYDASELAEVDEEGMQDAEDTPPAHVLSVFDN